MSFWDLLDMLPRSTAVKPQGCQLLFCKLFSFWQRKKLIKLPIFCYEVLSGKELPSGMTVGGGGASADRCLIEFFADTSSTANAVPLLTFCEA